MSTPFRTPALPARASGASSPSACSMWRSTPPATRGICTTRPISTIDRSPQTSPSVEAILARPECAWIRRDLEQKAQGYAIAHVVPEHLAEVRARKLELHRQDRSRGQGSPDQGDQLLGSPCRATEAAGAGGQAQCPAQLGRGPQARRRAAGAPGKAHGGAEAGSGRSRRCRRWFSVGLLVVPAGLIAAMTGRAVAGACRIAGHPGRGGARARDRDGDRARPRLRADRPRVREARLRHREPRPGHRQAALHRGEGPRQQARRRSR